MNEHSKQKPTSPSNALMLLLLSSLLITACSSAPLPRMSAPLSIKDCPQESTADPNQMTPPQPSGAYSGRVTAWRAASQQTLSVSPIKSDTSKPEKP